MKFFSRPNRTAQDASMLLEQWCALSQASGWIRESDWFCNAARSVAVTLCAGDEPSVVIRSLASRRAVQGVGISESLRDIQSLFGVYPHPKRDELLVSFADAWVEATDLFSHRLTCADATTGLSNRQHFERRVYELRENPMTRNEPYLLALFKHLHVDLDDMSTFMMAAEIGQEVAQSVPEAVATYRGNRLALLLPREMAVRSRLTQLGRSLEDVLEDYKLPRDSLRIDLEPLPQDAKEIQRVLGSLWS
ncbi:hypothetical protein CQ018_02595 [Arthrobacter sp. MYb227]|uniref:hypothetical protein n=1 Tax=Arthrobacter sp. MYb227 TaxID=1848601 RepID=UPI000CFDE81B|nr:hypothetical protein [Arthrobacter sp. MYb227]PQZ96185.1 hypothetical protein CQ018_02595 [Arthrobacter sp. MYb227]